MLCYFLLYFTNLYWSLTTEYSNPQYSLQFSRHSSRLLGYIRIDNMELSFQRWAVFSSMMEMFYSCLAQCGICIVFVQSLSHARLFVILWRAACQASLSITNSWSLLKLMSIESVMPSNHLSLCLPLLLPPSIFPSIRVFSNESVLHIRWPKYWSFSFNISPSNEHPGLISFRMDWLDLLAVPQWL